MSDVEKHRIGAQNAEQIAGWFRDRGGVAIWRSVNLSNPGASWTCPINGPDGKPAGKPNWQSDSQPERLITNPDEVEVVTGKEVRRFHIALKRGSGFSITLTPASSAKVKKAVAKAGKDAWYEFDYGAQEAVIFVSDAVVPLTSLIVRQPRPESLSSPA